MLCVLEASSRAVRAGFVFQVSGVSATVGDLNLPCACAQQHHSEEVSLLAEAAVLGGAQEHDKIHATSV